MAVFSLSDFADHEQVVFVSDDKSGLKAIIAVHNSNLGPALGGCRMWPYASEEEAVRETVAILKQAGLSPIEVTGHGTIEERLAEGHEIPAEERVLMDRALAENAVIVAQMEPLFGDEDEDGDQG